MSKTILTEVDGFIPVIDDLVKEVGLIPAAVFGKIWRYCQMDYGVCFASLETLANEIGLTKPTIIKHIDLLCREGYLEDVTPERRNRPHEYRDTGKAGLIGKITAGIGVKKIDSSESSGVKNLDSSKPRGVKNFYRGSQDSLLEDSNKKEIKKDSEGEPTPESLQPSKSPPTIYEPKPESMTLTGSAFGIAHHGEPIRNPRAAAALANGLERQKNGAPDLSWIRDEGLREMAALFIQLTRTPFTATDHSYWIKSLTQWRDLGVTRDDIIKTVNQMRKDNLTISSPNSLTAIIKDKIAERLVKGEDTEQTQAMQPGEDWMDYQARVERDFNQRYGTGGTIKP